MIFEKEISSKNILVIGDVMLDTYFYGNVERISPESPVPVFNKGSEKSTMGGAANVAQNLRAAGQNVTIMSIIGEDTKGERLLRLLDDQGIDAKLIVAIPNRQTTEKVRFLANGNHQVFRLDHETTEAISQDDCSKLLQILKQHINTFDLIILSDYKKGLLSLAFTQGVLQISKQNNIPTLVDVKGNDLLKYSESYLIKPNVKELHDLTGMPVTNDTEIVEASEFLRKQCNCNYVLTTCGSRGMVLISNENSPYFINSSEQEVFDVTGAGDTTIAYLAACLANKIDIQEAVSIANCAAGIQVSKVGTASVSWSEVRKYFAAQDQSLNHKLLNVNQIENFRKEHLNKTIVFTNGCFDILHIGHVRYLQKAAQLGDILIVGINNDSSIKRIKGSSRPINSELERAEIICALEFVDYVVIFEENTPINLIKAIRPDILVKGDDYANEYVIGTKEVEARGGKLVLIPFVKGKSTTNIINECKKKTS